MKINDYSKVALNLADPFNNFLSEQGKLYSYTKETVEGSHMISNIKLMLTAARKNKKQVFYAPHRHTEKGDYLNWRFLAPSHLGSKRTTLFKKGSWGAEFHTELQSVDGDIIIQNHWTASGFTNTDLDFLLKMHGIEEIILCGMRANTCIDSTARYGIESGYHVTLVKDAIGAFNWEEIRVTVEVNFPNYGHQLITAQEFADALK